MLRRIKTTICSHQHKLKVSQGHDWIYSCSQTCKQQWFMLLYFTVTLWSVKKHLVNTCASGRRFSLQSRRLAPMLKQQQCGRLDKYARQIWKQSFFNLSGRQLLTLFFFFLEKHRVIARLSNHWDKTSSETQSIWFCRGVWKQEKHFHVMPQLINRAQKHLKHLLQLGNDVNANVCLRQFL